MSGRARTARPSSGARPAPLDRRLLSGLVDLLLLAVPLAGGWWAWTEGSEPLVWVAAGVLGALVVTQWLAHALAGATAGRAFARLRTVDAQDLRPIGPGRVLGRLLVVLAGGLAAGVGALVVLASPAFDRSGRRRGWQDRAVGCEVIDVAEPVRTPPRRQDVPGARVAAHPARAAGLVATPPGVPAPAPAPEDAPAHPVAEPAPRAVHAVRQDAPVTVRVGRLPEPAPEEPTAPAVAVPAWAGSTEAPVTSGPLTLAPIAPHRQGADLDTQALPIVRPAAPVFGLDPELELTHRAPARPPRDEEPPPATGLPATGAQVQLTDGRVITIERVALVGRNPQSLRPDVQLVRVDDPGRSVSKTHLQVGVSSGGVWIADRGSTNGTVVTLPDGAQIVCPVDQQVRLRTGATVAFGDCGLRVLRAPGDEG